MFQKKPDWALDKDGNKTKAGGQDSNAEPSANAAAEEGQGAELSTEEVTQPQPPSTADQADGGASEMHEPDGETLNASEPLENVESQARINLLTNKTEH